jgi:CDP-2,3-bis-(O-geranylgeranyl)-sn-glycerol synthase
MVHGSRPGGDDGGHRAAGRTDAILGLIAARAGRGATPMGSPIAWTLQVLYLFAPLLAASAVAGLVLRFDLLSGLARPIDAGRTWRGRRLFGDGKTWRGVVVAVAVCVAGAAVQRHVVGGSAGDLALADYRTTNVFLFGAAMGGGAMLGELPNSFVKRRLGIARGETARGALAVLFYVWDQVDLLTTAWPLLSFWVQPTPALAATSVVVALVLHPLLSLLGWVVGARRTAR